MRFTSKTLSSPDILLSKQMFKHTCVSDIRHLGTVADIRTATEKRQQRDTWITTQICRPKWSRAYLLFSWDSIGSGLHFLRWNWAFVQNLCCRLFWLATATTGLIMLSCMCFLLPQEFRYVSVDCRPCRFLTAKKPIEPAGRWSAEEFISSLKFLICLTWSGSS